MTLIRTDADGHLTAPLAPVAGCVWNNAIFVLATASYEHRRLTPERLGAVLESAGFTLPRPTA